MFPSSSITSGLTFTKVIGGISKTLGIVNQAIPIYKEVKPIIGRASNIYSIFKEFRNAPNANSNSNSANNIKTITPTSINNITQKKVNNSSSLPIFFQ